MLLTIVEDIRGYDCHIVKGHTLSEWESKYKDEPDLWDFPKSELEDGSVDVNEDIWYWQIGNRLYETDEEV